MQFDFAAAIKALNEGLPFGDNFAFKIARTRVVPNEYLFNTILPTIERPDYEVKGGTMRIYPTMAQLLPMDTTPKPIGAIESSFFNENTAKWGGMMHFPEERLRELQKAASAAVATGLADGLATAALREIPAKRAVQAVLGLAELFLKSQFDNVEWLKGQALANGLINMTDGDGLELTVDYDVPNANKITRSGTSSYYNTGTMWWTDLRAVQKKLSNFRIIMNSNTYYSIIDNPDNKIRVVDEIGDTRSIVKFVGANELNSTDKRERTRVIIYDKAGSGITPKGVMKAEPFLKDGKIICVGESEPEGFELIEGSTPNPENRLRLGYGHMGPTVEGGRPGIYTDVFTPPGKAFQLMGETYANFLPCITNPKKLFILTTAMP